jgi:hypothetical protein
MPTLAQFGNVFDFGPAIATPQPATLPPRSRQVDDVGELRPRENPSPDVLSRDARRITARQRRFLTEASRGA